MDEEEQKREGTETWRNRNVKRWKCCLAWRDVCGGRLGNL